MTKYFLSFFIISLLNLSYAYSQPNDESHCQNFQEPSSISQDQSEVEQEKFSIFIEAMSSNANAR